MFFQEPNTVIGVVCTMAEVKIEVDVDVGAEIALVQGLEETALWGERTWLLEKQGGRLALDCA